MITAGVTAGGAAGDDGDVSVSVAAVAAAIAVTAAIGAAADGLLADGSTIRKPFETFILRKLFYWIRSHMHDIFSFLYDICLELILHFDICAIILRL